MSKTTLRNVKASVEVREFKDELSEAQQETVSGGIIAVLIGLLDAPAKEAARFRP